MNQVPEEKFFKGEKLTEVKDNTERQTDTPRDKQNERRRQLYSIKKATQSPEEKDKINAKRREQYIKKAAIQSPDEKDKINAKRRELFASLH